MATKQNTLIREKVSFDFKHGKVEGIYCAVSNRVAPLVIITHGQDGFYNYGMFPYVQQQLFRSGIASYSYNFSHGGIEGDSDYFSDLESYEKNCMRLETEDLKEIVRHLRLSYINFGDETPLFLLAHSLGGVPSIFAARQLMLEGYKIKGLILCSCLSTLNAWPRKMIKEWERNGVYYQKNECTMQELPLGRELLTEIKESEGKWNIRQALKEVNTGFLILHGNRDESVPVENSKFLHEWIKGDRGSSLLKIIPGGTHTYNTNHPFEGHSPQLDQMLEEVLTWIKKS
jgi:hypothetical protein